MGIILTSTGLPLLSTTGLAAPRRRATEFKPPKPEPAQITPRGPARSISHRGVTFNFSRDVHYYESATGEPVVISHADYMSPGTTITRIDPASTLVGGEQANGAMIDPAITFSYAPQGFDQGMVHAVTSQSYAPYDATLNADPGANGPIAINPGDKFTVVKSVRASGVDTTDDMKIVEKYVPLTIMDSLPPYAGTWFRPAASLPGASMAWKHRVEDINWSALRDLTAPAGLGKASAYLAALKAQKLEHIPAWAPTHDPGDRYQVLGEAGEYSRDYGRIRGLWANSLHLDPGTNQSEIAARRELAIILTQWGIDICGAHTRGVEGGNGAAQWYAIIGFAYIAAFLLGDTDMLFRARDHRSCSIGQLFWITDREIGYPTKWNFGSTGNGRRVTGETYQVTDLGVPEWTSEGWQGDGGIQPDSFVGAMGSLNANLHAFYRDGSFTTQVYEAIAIGLLRNGFGIGLTGDAAIRMGDYGPSNIRSAAIAYMDRSMTFDPWIKGGVTGHSTEAVAIYKAWRDLIPQPRWAGRPDVPQNPVDMPASGAREISAGAASGQISFRFNWLDYATKPITGREIQVSQDNKQFVDVDRINAGNAVGTAGTGTLSGFRPGTAHNGRWRQRNEHGWSRWTPTWEMSLAAGNDDPKYHANRNQVTTPGTSSGTLTNIVAPAVLHKPYPSHEMQLYEAVTDATDVTVFYAGMGYWRGGTGALSVGARQWQRDRGSGWASISGATGESYARTTADSGASIRCLVTVGGVQVASNAVSIPAAAIPDPGVLIDVDFTGSASFDWPDFWSALKAADSGSSRIELNFLHSVKLEPHVSRGTLWIKKTGASPVLQVEITPNAPAGTYNWEVEFGGGYFPASSADTASGDFLFRLRNASGAVRGNATLDVAKEDAPKMVAASGTFTINSGDADKSVHLYIACSVGLGGIGAALGGAILSKLKIWKR